MLQNVIFRFWDLDTNEHLILRYLLIYINGIKDIENKLYENDAKRRKNFNKKWKNVLLN